MTDRTTKRTHPAQGSRIAAAGIGMASMLGIVGAMGLAHRGQASTPPAPAPAPVAAPPQVLVVIHQDSGSPTVASTATSEVQVPVGSSASTQLAAVPTPSAAPVALTARPAVVAAPATARAAAPIAKTHGSR